MIIIYCRLFLVECVGKLKLVCSFDLNVLNRSKLFQFFSWTLNVSNLYCNIDNQILRQNSSAKVSEFVKISTELTCATALVSDPVVSAGPEDCVPAGESSLELTAHRFSSHVRRNASCCLTVYFSDLFTWHWQTVYYTSMIICFNSIKFISISVCNTQIKLFNYFLKLNTFY